MVWGGGVTGWDGWGCEWMKWVWGCEWMGWVHECRGKRIDYLDLKKRAI